MKVNFATAAFLAKLVIFRLEKNLRRNGTILASRFNNFGDGC